MRDFPCIRGSTVARKVSLSAVSQEALDLARADPYRDVPCVLVMLQMPNGHSAGAKLTFAEADRMARHLTGLVAEHARNNGGKPTGLPSPSPPPMAPPTRPEAKLGTRVRRLRNAEGLSQKDFAAKVGCSPTTIAHTEISRLIPSDALLCRIAVTLGASRMELRDLARQERPPRRRRGPPPKASRRETA